MFLLGRRICLAVTGSIAAYKSVFLLRLLIQEGAEVQVMLSSGAQQFVSALTFQALSTRPVRTDLWDSDAEAAMSHIELAKWADLILIAPATANCISKLAVGLADDLLLSVCLATRAPIILAPAMNQYMYSHRAIQDNLTLLRSRGVEILEPAVGFQACGDVDKGRMVEPNEILLSLSHRVSHCLKGVKLLLTAGPTIEPIDPVRFLSNHSSGKMGYALAEQAANMGADVTLVTGPTALPVPHAVRVKKVVTAEAMHEAVMRRVEFCDVFIGVAAVADYRPESILSNKIKKTSASLTLNLVKNPDIVQEVSLLEKKPLLVAFSAETENVLANARQKRLKKSVDIMVANQVGENTVFNQDVSTVTLITDHFEKTISNKPKRVIAQDVLQLVSQQLTRVKSARPITVRDACN